MAAPKMIVVAGGPSAGKTAVLQHLSDLLRRHQFRPLLVPAMLPQMESFGMRFKDDCITEDQLLKWESVQRRMQVEQEETTKFAATKFGFKNPVILVDRGLPSAYISMVQYDLLMRKAALKDRISLDRYDGVIYMRTRTDEEQVLTFDDGDLSKRHRQEIQEDVDKLRERNEEVWQQHPNFVLIDALPHDKFRKRLQLAGEGLAKLLNFKLESGWDSSLDQTLPT